MRRTKEEWLVIAKKLAKKHGGLPHSKWLLAHKYSGLIAARLKYPDDFKDIPLKSRKHPDMFRGKPAPEWVLIVRSAKIATDRDYVALAKKVARANKGILPKAGLIKFLNKEFYKTMRYHPDWFAGMKQATGKYPEGKEIVAKKVFTPEEIKKRRKAAGLL